VDITAFNVGFGDCFLLSFVYAKETRYVLIDFGSTSPPKTDPTLVKAARAIAKACGNRLDAVVATHRHRDHISGFTAGTPAGDIIRKCADAGKALVVQPWTEKPNAPTNATGKRRISSKAAYLQQLESMHAFAGVVRDETKRLSRLPMDAAVGEPMHRAETIGTEQEPGDDAIEERRKVSVATDLAGRRPASRSWRGCSSSGKTTRRTCAPSTI
jgi:ribonuclease BN (tRNA processing enzyme)